MALLSRLLRMAGLDRVSRAQWALFFYLAVLTNLGATWLVYTDGLNQFIPLGLCAAAVNVTILFSIHALKVD